MEPLVGVVLAAGRGRRLGSLGETYVKTLLPVANEPVIAHHLRLMRSLGVSRVFVVVGHHAEDVSNAVGSGDRYGVDVEYVPQSGPLGSAHALGAVRGRVRGPFLLTLGDYYFVARDAEAMTRRLSRGESAIATKHEPLSRLIRDACSVEVDADNRVMGIVEKPVDPVTDLKGTGFYALTPRFFDALNRTPRTALRDEYELSVALDIFVQMGQPLYGEPIVEWDSNITTPVDLLQCNLEWLARHQLSSLVGDEAVIDDATELDRAIVGGGADLRGVSRLSEVVVFPGAQYASGWPVERSLLTPAGAVHC